MQMALSSSVLDASLSNSELLSAPTLARPLPPTAPMRRPAPPRRRRIPIYVSSCCASFQPFRFRFRRKTKGCNPPPDSQRGLRMPKTESRKRCTYLWCDLRIAARLTKVPKFRRSRQCASAVSLRAAGKRPNHPPTGFFPVGGGHDTKSFRRRQGGKKRKPAERGTSNAAFDGLRDQTMDGPWGRPWMVCEVDHGWSVG